MDDIRVALFTGNYNHIRDGVSLTLNRLVKFLEDQGIPVLIFAPTIKNPPIKHCGTLVPVPSVPLLVGGRSEYRFSISLPQSAKKQLEEFAPTIVHIATPDVLGFKALKWAKKNKVKAVSSYHTHFPSYLDYYKLNFISDLGWRYVRWFYKQFEHVYVPSQSMIDELEKHRVKSDLKIWARGIDTELFSPEKRSEEWRKKAGFAPDDIVVAFVSRLVWEKELATFIESVKAVAKKNPKVRALVVGEGPAKEEAQAMLPKAHFTGFCKGEDLARAYASSDVFLFPSHTETFGNVTLEAMASGLPCIVADAIGSKSLVEDGINGYLAGARNIADFTVKLEMVVTHHDMLHQMGRASREKALDYTWDKINGSLLNYYKSL